ncbi:hypothetical protein HMPREF1210_01555 [Paenisporosarcina sp. HGH0030]|uniref:nuclear transport factor 2 family protein n=1 Tax=Paenisporosarcina sp. HGH0030 TaxID=1078085 RepID=UPI00034E5467|nr:nuclear transport factor 2 family protein [Paenisporosarcina sp. HGH0030]EPD52202.1 hypothetical protein HMPREF1210_01555 [Paenisporosarcina sp. HGH0030]
MKFKYMMVLALISILLSACASEEDRGGAGSVSDGETSSENNALEHGVKNQDQEQSDVGFEMSGSDIEEAQDVPVDEKKAILSAFDTYMTSFNNEDFETYMSVIAKEPEGFDYKEEEEMIKKTFKEYKVKRTAEDVTVIKYDKSQAQVFASLAISLEQESTGAKLDRTGRQVTVFAKEDGNWRVSSVYFIGDVAE